MVCYIRSFYQTTVRTKLPATEVIHFDDASHKWDAFFGRSYFKRKNSVKKTNKNSVRTAQVQHLVAIQETKQTRGGQKKQKKLQAQNKKYRYMTLTSALLP